MYQNATFFFPDWVPSTVFMLHYFIKMSSAVLSKALHISAHYSFHLAVWNYSEFIIVYPIGSSNVLFFLFQLYLSIPSFPTNCWSLHLNSSPSMQPYSLSSLRLLLCTPTSNDTSWKWHFLFLIFPFLLHNIPWGLE